MRSVNKEIRIELNKQFKQYFDDYWFVHNKYRSPLELFNLQCSINEIINKFNTILLDYKKNSSSKNNKRKEEYKLTVYNLKFIIKIYKLLIDDIVIKYICENDCSLFAQLVDDLNTSISNNTSYNYNNVLEYLNVAKLQDLNTDVYVVVCDLSSKCLKCGDIVTYSNGKLNYVELKKDCVKNTKLLDMIRNNGDLSSLNKHDSEQVKRLIKQMSKHEHLDRYYNRPMNDPGTMRFFDFNTSAKTYLEQLKEDINKLSSKRFAENKVDNCISYLVVKDDGEKKYDRLLETKLKQYKPNNLNIYTYNEFIFDSVYSRPYQLNWGKRIYKKLLRSQVLIFIQIDLKQLFLELKKSIPNLMIRKAELVDYEETPLYIIGNKMIFFDTKNGPFYIGKGIIYKIVAGLYITRSAAEYYYNSILKYYPKVFYSG